MIPDTGGVFTDRAAALQESLAGAGILIRMTGELMNDPVKPRRVTDKTAPRINTDSPACGH